MIGRRAPGPGAAVQRNLPPARPAMPAAVTPGGVTATDTGTGRAEAGQPTMRWVVQNDVRSVVVAAWAAALNSAVVETPYQCEVA